MDSLSDHGITLSGNFQDHKSCVSYYCQEKNPAHARPISTDDSGSIALTTTSLGHGVAEVLSKEMPPGTTQIGVPHFRHTTPNSVCDGVDAEAHKIVNGRHVHCCCCRSIFEMSAKNTGDWWDHLEDGTLFGCLFEAGENPEEMYVAHAGMATTGEARDDKPGCPCEYGSSVVSTSTTNSDSLQCDQGYSTCNRKICFNTSQILSGSSESTSSGAEAEVCLDLTQENIRLRQETDSVLKLLLQWKRDGDKPAWSMVAPYGRELKAYWHVWDIIELKDDILFMKRFRDVGNDAEYLFLVLEALRKEVFRQLHECVTAGHLGRRKTYDKIKKRFYWCNMQKDVSYWCRICSTCGSRKMPYRHAKAPMRQYNVGYPMERIGVDICGPYPISKKGNKYLMVVSCYFTK